MVEKKHELSAVDVIIRDIFVIGSGKSEILLTTDKVETSSMHTAYLIFTCHTYIYVIFLLKLWLIMLMAQTT